ncbi:MAG: hypothetical protein FWD34_08105 [Oscillospiraceae bacterium]|nr:hypothetical protein [Oscillospiraceae bacterium]
MRKLILLLTALLILTACGSKTADGEIVIPVYEAEVIQSRTANAQIMDLTSRKAIPANFGCPFALSIITRNSGNLIEFNPARREFSEGEIIAVIDSSELNLERANRQSTVNSALSLWQSSGSERDRLRYLIELEELKKIDSRIAGYTIVAPYDCVIVQTTERNVGDYVNEGEILCLIARYDEIFIYTSDSLSLFAIGMDVDISLGSFSYTGKVTYDSSLAPAHASPQARYITVIKPNEGELDRIFEETPGALGAGWATVYVTVSDYRDVLAVPDWAVIRSGNANFCIIYSNGQRMRTPVSVGESVNGFTIILNGIAEGDVVYL